MSIHATSTESYTGKNLFDKNNPNLFSGYFDGDIPSPTIVSGVANRNRIIFIPCKPNTTYSLSAQSFQGIAQVQVGTTSVMPAAGVSVYNLGYFGNNKTTPNDAKYLLARIQSNVGVDIADVLQDFLDGLQIEIGSTATSYEPYISHFGKNLFNWNYIASSGATFGTNNNNGTVEVDTYGIHYKNPTSADQYFTVNGYGAVEPNIASVMRMYNLSPNTRYTISYTATNYSQVFIRFFNLGGGIVGTLSNSTAAAGRVSFSFTVPASAYGYQIRVDNEAYGHDLPSLNNDISNIQIEEGSVATSYEPYVGSLPSPLIRDVAHVSTSKNLLNMQSSSNGEYFGTMSQHGITWKNLYIGSPFFSDYRNIGSWEDGGTYNGMPVIKKADSWGGAFNPVGVIAGKTYTFSAWVKSDQARAVAIYATGGSTGATATISPLSKSITTSTDWERVSFTFTCTTSGSASLRFENTSSSTTNYTYISGYQLELGPEATSYEQYIGDGVYSGKNQLGLTSRSQGGITGDVNSDGTISITGKATTSSGCLIFSPLPIKAGTYTMSISKPMTGDLVWSLAQGVEFRITPGNTSVTKTLSNDYGGGGFYFKPVSGTTYNETLSIQVVAGSTPDYDFEPYVGGVPSPNPDYPQEVVTGKLASKNLCPDTAEGYYVTSTSTGWGKTNVDSGVLIAVEPNTDYTISTTATQSRYRFCFVASLDNYTGYNGGVNDGGSNTYRKNSGSYPYLIVNATDLSKIQVEKGSTATAFEPYFTPIELAQMGSYQDRVYKSGDDWYIEKPINGMKLGSSTNFVLYTGVSDTGFTFFKAAVATPRGRQCMSNYFTTSYIGWNNLQNEHIEMLQAYTNDSLYLKTKTSRISSTDALNTWLSNRDVRAYYILATATNTAITDSATIAWLNKYDTDSLPHYKYVNTRRTTYVGASGLASAIDLYDGSYASILPTYTTANDHHLTTANDGTYTVSLQNISAKIVSGTVTFSVFTNQRKIDFSWNGSATSTNVSVSLQADEYIKSIYAYIPQDADAGITLSQQLESGSLTDFEPYYNIVKIYAGDDLVFEDTSLTD